jgi:hypothetical protein
MNPRSFSDGLFNTNAHSELADSFAAIEYLHRRTDNNRQSRFAQWQSTRSSARMTRAPSFAGGNSCDTTEFTTAGRDASRNYESQPCPSPKLKERHTLRFSSRRGESPQTLPRARVCAGSTRYSNGNVNPNVISE